MVDFNLIIKYFAGKAAPEEAMQVEDWAKTSPEHEGYFHNLNQSWLEAGNELYTRPDIQQEWEHFSEKHAHNQVEQLVPRKTQWLSRAAAIIAFVAVGVGGFYMFNSKNQNQPTTIAEAKDKAIQLKLEDGTKVQVLPGGELVYPVQFKKEIREVTLVGNGSFDIVHLPQQPFIVHLGDLHVKVLGTAFDIERTKKWIAVKVKRGKVAFYNSSDTVIVGEGAIGKFIKADKKLVLEEAAPLLGTFHFNNTPLKAVAAELAAHFKVKVNITNAGLNNCMLSAGFEEQSLQEILTAISTTFNFKCTLEGQTVQISGKACK